MTLSLYDARPFFEKALQYGVQHGLLDQSKLDAICADAPKGMVQIARYLGNENLRPDIELAKNRIVNLVSLHLEHATNGDLHSAAQMLRDNSFLSRSKAGSDMLKALIVMPQNTHFAMNERRDFEAEHIPILAKWSLRPLADYQAELAARSQVARVLDAALWMADFYGLDDDALVEAGTDAEAVMRTALLALTFKVKQLPDWAGFESIIHTLRRHVALQGTMPALVLPKNLPSEYWPVLESVHASMLNDLPKLWDANLPIRKLFLQTPAFIGRYFWQENPLGDMDSYEREVDDKHAARMQQSSETWQAVTQGHSDDATLLTVFLCVATGAKPTACFTESAAKTLVRKIRKAVLDGQAGVDSNKVSHFIEEHAPPAYQTAFGKLWQEFLIDALAILKSDFDYEMHDALAHLRLHCHIK